LVLVGCAVDAGDEALAVDESELQYCGDEPCEPYEPPPAIARPDLVAAGSSCNYVPYNYTSYKLPVRISNNGTATIGQTVARVQFKISYTGFVTAPNDYTIPTLQPGQSYLLYFTVNAGCYLQLAGCDITVTANHDGMWSEATRVNNASTWHCAKPT
jgi:hypothetical protein